MAGEGSVLPADTSAWKRLKMSAGMLLAGFCFLALPDLLMPGSFVERITHDDTMTVMTMLALFLGILNLCIACMKRPGLSAGRKDAVFAIGLLVILEVPVLCFAVPNLRDCLRARDLMTHGVPAQARLVRQIATGCGKAGCGNELLYSFTPTGTRQPVSGAVRVSSARGETDPAYTYAVDTGTVPILYDPRDPSHSMLYWQDRIARQASLSDALQITGILMVFPVIFWAIMMLIGLNAARRKRLARETDAGTL